MDQPHHTALFAGLFLALLCAGCGGASEPAHGGAPSGTAARPVEPARAAPTRVEVPEPTRPMRGPIDNEALSETVDAWFEGLGNRLRIRDFDAFERALHPDLAAERIFPSASSTGHVLERLPLGVERIRLAAPTEVLDRDAFVGSLEATVGPWARVTQAKIRVRGAKFEEDRATDLVESAYVDLALHVVGDEVDGGTVVLDGLARALLVNEAGEWRILRLRLTERSLLRRGRRMFSEVSRAAGVAFDGKRFGEPGNDGDGWSGVASADVDGDGLLDVYVPGPEGSFLYVQDGAGAFVDEAEERGLAAFTGGTGAVFFDYDRDGDQDLAVAFIGWIGLDDSLLGSPVRIFENDGEGRFADRTESLGVAEVRMPAYSLTAFDADGDGWTDLFACGYGRMEHEVNDSWLSARNGASDLLLANRGGEAFEDVTVAAGLDDRSWSYASAAADFDEDGDLDLFIGNNFGRSRLMRNRGDGTFEDVAAALGAEVQGNVMGAVWTDLDADGRLDLYLASPTSTSGSRLLSSVEGERGRGSSLSMMQMANGNKAFFGRVEDGRSTFAAADVGGTRAGWAWSVATPDIDLDGARDIVCVNGFVTGEITGDT
ncbi:MAG: VCBS repeat-containing protein [Planctomycetota bacterium]